MRKKEKPIYKGAKVTISLLQGIVTVIRPVEPFATMIKIKSRDQDVICSESSNQGTLQRGDQAAQKLFLI